jgi:TP901 family phage tail tape measure protein
VSLQAASLYATVSVAGAGQSVRDLNNVSRAVDRAQAHMTILGKKSAGIGKGIGQLAQGTWNIAKTMAASVALLAAGGVAAAISFEDAFANVKKTVEGTPEELRALDEALKALSTRIPVSYQDLTAIATEAGALDVATHSVDEFTEAVARTTRATVGLEVNEAAEAFGKLGTIFDLHGDDFNRLGSVLVELGRSGASTEADIIAVTKRFASAGQQAGLSASQVLGWSSALASLGPEAEAAGGALQRSFNRLTQNIALMGEDNIKGRNAKKRVDAFARVSGMTVDEFVSMYTTDASGAMEKFITGLAGSDKFTVQREFVKAGIINQRDIYALSSFANRYEILDKQLRMSNKAWAENTALTEVSSNRFDTLKSKIQILWNTLKLGANAFGEGLLDPLARVAVRAKDLLMRHMGDFRQWGLEAGRAVDSIDWSRVESAIRTVADIGKVALDLVKQIPAEISLSVVGLLGLNKVSGGLFAKGVGNVVGGIFDQFLARGASPANPMWVASVGGLGGSGTPGGKGGGVPLGAAGAAGLLVLAATSVAGDTAPGARDAGMGTQPSEYLQMLLGMQKEGRGAERVGANETVDQAIARMNTSGEASMSMTGSGSPIAALSDTARRLGMSLGELAGTVEKQNRVGVWKSLGDGAKAALEGIAGRGKEKFGSERSAAQVMGTFGRNIMRNEARILASGNSQIAKLGDLKRLHQIAIDGKDWGTARKIQKSIDSLKARMKAEADQTQVKQAQTTKAAQAAAFAIEHKDFKAEVDVYPSVSHFTIDGRQIAHSVQKWLPGVRRG